MSLLEKIKNHKFRCSSLGRILNGFTEGLTETEAIKLNALEVKSKTDALTPKQRETYESYLLKDSLTPTQQKALKDYESKINQGPLSDSNKKMLNQLITKRDSPPIMGKGGYYYLKELLEEYIFGRSERVHTEFMEKGILCEPESLSLVQRVEKTYMTKNEKTYDHHDLIIGTPDIVKDKVIDIKSSWTRKSFPFFDQKIKGDYYWQLIGYLILTELKEAELKYVLTDTPFKIIDSVLQRQAWNYGCTTIDSLDPRLVKETVANHLYTFDGLNKYCAHNPNVDINWFIGYFKEIPEKTRLRTFHVTLTDEVHEKCIKWLGIARNKMIDMFIEMYEQDEIEENFLKQKDLI